ncbi:MAG TPA: hypothetical protein PK566_13730 [Pseudobacteroides sp.]|nr:hypothetical protein [Pseudobacteroides sp.]
MNIEFRGNLDGIGSPCVIVDGQYYLVKKATFEKFSHCSNAKCLVESIECFAYEEIVKNGLANNEYFEKATK